VDADKHMLEGSDALLGWTPMDVPFVGTSMEVYIAWTLGIPVYLWGCRDKDWSPWLIIHSSRRFLALEQALEMFP
jgi:hypothetical protein